jgi:hypothetical protein
VDEKVRTNGRHKTGIQNLANEPEQKRPLGRSSEGERIILKLILIKEEGQVWTVLIWLRTITSGCSFVNTALNFRLP